LRGRKTGAEKSRRPVLRPRPCASTGRRERRICRGGLASLRRVLCRICQRGSSSRRCSCCCRGCLYGRCCCCCRRRCSPSASSSSRNFSPFADPSGARRPRPLVADRGRRQRPRRRVLPEERVRQRLARRQPLRRVVPQQSRDEVDQGPRACGQRRVGEPAELLSERRDLGHRFHRALRARAGGPV